MKKYILCTFIIMILIGLALNLTKVVLASNLYKFVTNKRNVNVMIEQFSDGGDVDEIDATKLTDAFKQALLNRQSVNFNIVDTERDADLLIKGKIKNFVYSEKDPVDILLPIGLVLDLVTTTNYARLEYGVEVYNTKKEKVAWKRHLRATVNKSEMPESDSIPLVIERAADVFIRDCFSKKYYERD